MSPRSLEHENAIRCLIDWLVAALDHARFQFMINDLERRCVAAHRDRARGAYREVGIVARGETIAPRAVQIGALDTDALFAAAFAEGM